LGGYGGLDGTAGSGGMSGGGGMSGSGATESAGNGNVGGSPGTTSCVEITPGNGWSTAQYGSITVYDDSVTVNLGTTTTDTLQLFVMDGSTGTFDLSADTDLRGGFSHGFFLTVGDGTDSSTEFFQASGTLQISADSSPLDGTIDATATDVTLVQVYAGLPVPGGACLHFASATIQLP
jgi:hypothetical protein